MPGRKNILKASTIIETIVAMVLVLLISGLVTSLISNTFRNTKTRLLLSQARVKEIHFHTITQMQYEDDTFEYDDMIIEKSVVAHENSKKVLHIMYDVYDLQKNELFQVNKLVFNP